VALVRASSGQPAVIFEAIRTRPSVLDAIAGRQLQELTGSLRGEVFALTFDESRASLAT
jgi:hypothetical protein